MVPSLMAATDIAPDDLFAVWVDGPAGPSRLRGRAASQAASEVRFAFYGRISTEGYQDPVSSRRWQSEIAEFMTHGHGRIGVEFFDVGCSRSLSWHDRPAAAELLAEALRPDRRFDAVVIGEYERAFAGRQALQVIPYLHAQGVAVWLPGVRWSGGFGRSDAPGVVPAVGESVGAGGVTGSPDGQPVCIR
ncbi:hypothetical protein GCM10023107_95940 [Actinoplanes octamycinicus]|nr:hypothetical protein [Actinoplanes octamycinicus]GIE56743.1 hypothetical protein Aoc01nite_21450 [Actinoplanes octamycinicus]